MKAHRLARNRSEHALASFIRGKVGESEVMVHFWAKGPTMRRKLNHIAHSLKENGYSVELVGHTSEPVGGSPVFDEYRTELFVGVEGAKHVFSSSWL